MYDASEKKKRKKKTTELKVLQALVLIKRCSAYWSGRGLEEISDDFSRGKRRSWQTMEYRK